MPPTAPPPTEQMDDEAPPMDAPADDTAGPAVLLTVMSNGDGTYSLQSSDEPEALPNGGEGGGMGAAPAPTTYDSPGALLKAILDIVKADMEASSGEGGAEENFQAGFSDDAPARAEPTLAQKY